MSRATTAVIDLDALRHNYRVACNNASGSRVIAVIKANGYGHDQVRVARALRDAEQFAVACIEEAMGLREAGITKPILLLEGVFEASELPICSRLGFDVAVHHATQVEMLEQARLDNPVRVWLKIDSGMHRLGVAPEAAAGLWRRLSDCPAVAPGMRLMSHLANADDRTDDYTREQLRVFSDAIDGLAGVETSLANSAGILGWPDTHFDCVRAGLMLYGASPLLDSTGPDDGLRPAMTLFTKLISIKRLRKGEPVGYSCTWRCPEDMDVGIAAIGYGDGYPRHAPSGSPVLINGSQAEVIGRVSMDMLCLDLRRHAEARVGDTVELWGEGLPVEHLAHAAGTIPYTLLCGVTSRVHFRERESVEQ